jgi:cephalosporin-C deacetylase-like acetyl esterase
MGKGNKKKKTRATAAVGAGNRKGRFEEREVSFKTEDGWTLRGMYSCPRGARRSIPAVVFLHSFEHDREVFGYYIYPGLAEVIGSRGVATLRFDLRGRGQSRGKKELHSFSPEEMSRLYLDVRAALSFLERQARVDATRVAIVAEQQSAEAAVIGWSGDNRVCAITLLTGHLSDAAKNQIAANPDIPIFLIASKEDRKSFKDMASAYNLTRNPNSRIRVYWNLGMGTGMFGFYRLLHPEDRPMEEDIADWMIDRLML